MPLMTYPTATPGKLADAELLHWLALVLTPGLGTKRTLDLLRQHGSAEAILRLDAHELEAEGVSPAVARSLSSGCMFE